MVGAIYHRLITTTRKRADVDEDQYCGQLPSNIIIQLIINSVFSVIMILISEYIYSFYSQTEFKSTFQDNL